MQGRPKESTPLPSSLGVNNRALPAHVARPEQEESLSRGSNEFSTVSNHAALRGRIASDWFPGVLCGRRHSSTEGTLGAS